MCCSKLRPYPNKTHLHPKFSASPSASHRLHSPPLQAPLLTGLQPLPSLAPKFTPTPLPSTETLTIQIKFDTESAGKMSDNSTTEVDEDHNNKIKKGKTKPCRKVHDSVDLPSKNRLKGIILSVTKPSYTLRRGIGNSRPDKGSLRSENRSKLRHLLRQLVRRHNWEEASGVLSVLLKGTCKETSISKNRTKYWVTMELLKYIKGDSINQRKIQRVFELWMKKIGSMRNWPMKDRFVVQLEFILFCLTHGNIEDAHQAIICLMQEPDFGSDPISNLVVGLTFCQLWYTAIRKEFPLRDLDESCTLMESEILESRFHVSIETSKGHDAVEVQEANSPFRRDSNTSVRNDKEIGLEDVVDQHTEVAMEVDDNLQRETPHQNFQPQGFYVNSAESSGHEGSSFSNHADYMPRASIFYTRGLEQWLLPLRLPQSNENLEDFIFMRRKMHNDYYKGAVNYLRVALHSTPPVSEALLPLIQMLLLGDHIKEAIDELEKFVHNSDTALPLRLKASLMEHFHNNYVELSTCFEDVLKKDPTCSHSLTRLVSMHRNGDYSAEKLLEMISLHLDATYAECNTWKEFASCLLKLFQCEEDRMSMCLDGEHKQRYSNHLSRAPEVLTDGLLGKNWRFRCRWWLTRHFSQRIIAAEIAAGDLQLLTYKAASACHLYGREFEYVVKASTCLEKEENRDMFSFLQMHMQNSVGFYFNFDNRNR